MQQHFHVGGRRAALDVSCGRWSFTGLPAIWRHLHPLHQPLLKLLASDIGEENLSRAFADDIAMVLDSIHKLAKVAKTSKIFASASGLHVKAKKCAIVPLGRRLECGLKSEIRKFLDLHISHWSDFAVEASARYLGYILGPDALTSRWSAAADKWESRTRQLAVAGIACSIAFRHYNSRAVSTLLYIAQRTAPAQHLDKTERLLIQKLMRALHNTFPKNLPFVLHEVGAVAPVSFKASCLAAAVRAAVCTCKTWRNDKLLLDWTRVCDPSMASLDGSGRSTCDRTP